MNTKGECEIEHECTCTSNSSSYASLRSPSDSQVNRPRQINVVVRVKNTSSLGERANK